MGLNNFRMHSVIEHPTTGDWWAVSDIEIIDGDTIVTIRSLSNGGRQHWMPGALSLWRLIGTPDKAEHGTEEKR